jgi:ABC-type Zn uptake system ZnuABC Zn-binding protein ZnuA
MLKVKRLNVSDIDETFGGDEMEYYQIIFNGRACIATYDPKQETVVKVSDLTMSYSRANQYIKWFHQGVV